MNYARAGRGERKTSCEDGNARHKDLYILYTTTAGNTATAVNSTEATGVAAPPPSWLPHSPAYEKKEINSPRTGNTTHSAPPR